MKMKLAAVLFVTSLSSVSIGVPAQQAPDKEVPVGSTFKRLDVNADGKVDRNEVGADPDLIGQFGTYDLNADGVITPEEMQRWEEARGSRKESKESQ